MPSKKRKYNARFPAGRIKKIMQTDEEVGKVAQAVPIIISRTPRTLELFVQSLLSRAMNVTMARNAKTLSPSHVKQCILAESRFDFLRDLVKNIPDVSAAEEKEMQMSAESSPNSSRFSDTSAQPRRVVREDSNSSSSSDVRPPKDILKSTLSGEVELKPRIETVTNIPPTSTVVSTDAAIDLSKKRDERPVRTANFYQETLVDPVQHKSVITVNPTYSHPQPSTSNYASLAPVEPLARIEAQIKKPDVKPFFYLDVRQDNDISMTPPRTPVTPILNIDFTKNLANPEIKVLDTTVASIVSTKDKLKEKFHRQNSRHKSERRVSKPATPVDIDHINSGTLQIDEDYDT